ncbi:hypothetical protein E2C01_028254 [Portunus trituberculatus]|uniref:Shisa N-terminal domain-containing protein n=1 Tax=Portunus trituberculatus TaxID=210409 RepID=A0A5B7EK58_PORTR|nr:hypothetical protein [Portunus trituberculatus]
MDRLLKVVLLVVSLAATGSSFRCERENLWGSTQYFSCPEPGDNPNDVYCCGFGDNKFCCSSQAQEEILEEFFDKIGVIGVLVTNRLPDDGFVIREAIGRQEGGHFAPLVAMISGDSSEEEEDSGGGGGGGIFTSLKGHLNHTMRIIQEGFEGTVDRLKERVKKKVKQKVKEKMVKSEVPSVPLALAQVQAEDTKQRALAKLNDTVRATKDKVKTTIGGKVKDIKDKVKTKINSTVSDTKAKAKQKVKDKVKEKASKKLDPTGGQ